MRPPSPQTAKWRSISHLIMWLASGRGRCGPKTAATSSASAKPSSRAASQCFEAGVASWVRKATCSPRAMAAIALRVPPWENSCLAMRWIVAPWCSAISTEPSVEPESQMSSSTSRSTSWARTAASTSSR